MSKTVLFQTIQFSISTQFSSIWPIDRTLSGTPTLGQSGTGSDDNEGVLCILQSSGITWPSLSDCLVSYQGHSCRGGGFLPLCREAVGVFYSPSRLGNFFKVFWAIISLNGSGDWCSIPGRVIPKTKKMLLIPLKNSCLTHARWSKKQSDTFHTFLWHFFQV